MQSSWNLCLMPPGAGETTSNLSCTAQVAEAEVEEVEEVLGLVDSVVGTSEGIRSVYMVVVVATILCSSVGPLKNSSLKVSTNVAPAATVCNEEGKGEGDGFRSHRTAATAARPAADLERNRTVRIPRSSAETRLRLTRSHDVSIPGRQPGRPPKPATPRPCLTTRGRSGRLKPFGKCEKQGIPGRNCLQKWQQKPPANVPGHRVTPII